MQALKNNALIISILALKHKAYQQACTLHNLSRFELDILMAASAFCKENISFSMRELSDYSGHDSGNICRAVKKLERAALVQCVYRSKKCNTAHSYVITGQGNALLRKVCNLYQKAEQIV